MPQCKQGKRGCRGKTGATGHAEANVTFGSLRLVAEITPVDPIYLLLNGNALETGGVATSETNLNLQTFVASEDSDRLDVSASIDGSLTGARVNLTVQVLAPNGTLLEETDPIPLFAPFDFYGDVELRVRPGNLVRVIADQGFTLTADEYSGITVILRFYTAEPED